MTYRVTHHDRQVEPGRFVVRVSSAEVSTVRLRVVWQGSAPAPERRPDSVRLNLPRLTRADRIGRQEEDR